MVVRVTAAPLEQPPVSVVQNSLLRSWYLSPRRLQRSKFLDHSSWLSSNSLLWRLLNATERKGRSIHINSQITARFTDDCEVSSVYKDYHYNGELLNDFWSLLFLLFRFKSCLTSYILLCLLSYLKKKTNLRIIISFMI